jgi:drug/metabolite transporter (DMT)-like permease
MLPLAIPKGVTMRWRADAWRVAAWGVGDSLAYLAFVAAAHRGPVSLASVLAAQFATVAVVVATVFFGERPRSASSLASVSSSLRSRRSPR